MDNQTRALLADLIETSGGYITLIDEDGTERDVFVEKEYTDGRLRVQYIEPKKYIKQQVYPYEPRPRSFIVNPKKDDVDFCPCKRTLHA